MAKLINCKVCKSEMSSKADKCPKCGEKIHRTSPIAWALLLVILYFLYIVFSGPSNSKPKYGVNGSVTNSKVYKAEDFLNAAHSSKEVQGTIWNSMSKDEQDKAGKIMWEERKDLIPYFYDKTYDPKSKTLYINNNRN